LGEKTLWTPRGCPGQTLFEKKGLPQLPLTLGPQNKGVIIPKEVKHRRKCQLPGTPGEIFTGPLATLVLWVEIARRWISENSRTLGKKVNS